MQFKVLLALAVFTAATALGGCGGGGDGPAGPADTIASPTPAPTPAPVADNPANPANPPATPTPGGSDAQAHTLVLAGIDGLTEGSHGSTWRTYFLDATRGGLGDGGPGYIGFGDSATVRTADLQRFRIRDAMGRLSLDGRGLAVAAGTGSAAFSLTPPSLWSSARLFYLRQPGGGSMQCQATAADAASQAVQTDAAANTLAWIDLAYQPAAGGGGTGVGCSQITGKVTVFGTLFSLGSAGIQLSNLGRRGEWLASVAAQDSDMRRQWFAALKPAAYLLNGGLNDRDARTPQQHESDLLAIVQDIVAASPATRILIVQANETRDWYTSALAAFAPRKQSVATRTGAAYVDLRSLLGSFPLATASGYMADDYHPSDAGNRLIGPYLADQLGLRSLLPDPGPTAFPSLATP
ncbi:SGNH/GDSL hydrolase family protein [Cupriavidus sp. 30B13]|uniref:SGNH/GDSL hydrolase family protein n=1 Tax=Cupriavidus sp. 30B13 TaxID=3384241 RepID=UPI003B916F2A